MKHIYKTADRSNFKKHVELHLNPRQFLCPLCKYAASKKCNLQYHIKSRHSGCKVPVDVSKVKLRVKKPGADDTSRASKFENSSSVEEDFDVDEDEELDPIDKQSSPINLSIKKSSKPSVAQPVQSETPDKVQKKANEKASSEKDKLPKTKDKMEPEKKVSTRQKKMEKINENPVESTGTQTEAVPAAANADSKVKRRVKKPPVEKTAVQDQAEVTEPEKDQKETEKSDQQRAVEERAVRHKVEKEEEKRPEKEKEQLKTESSGKDNKSLNKPRKSGSKKSEKSAESAEAAPQKPDSPEKKEKSVKEKAAKRKAVEALDLSKKSSSETPTKTRRLKATTAEKLQSKSASEDVNKTNDATPTQHKSTTTKQKKTRNSNQKATGLQQTAKDKTSPVNIQTSAQLHDPTPDPPQDAAPMEETPPSVPEKTLDKPSEKMEVSPAGSSVEDTPAPAEGRPAPTFAKPTSPPSLLLPSQRSKPADPEDDEGIHSSHEGGSDISDSASEGSDDSGLNGNGGAGSGKMANDPETPTDEIPTPTELKSHMCIFCDRTFPLEVEYRRHLNRHLVNVYYMDNTAKGQK